MSYQSEYSGAQVDEAVGKALNPDATPTQDSTNLVTSGGVYAAMQVEDVSSFFENCTVRYARKVGHIVCFSVLIQGISCTANSNAIIHIIKSGLYPPTSISVVSSPNSPAYSINPAAYIAADGNIVIRPGPVALSGFDCNFAGTFIK